MAYNPFDDMILEDPAYMNNGGETPTTDQKPKDLGYYSNMFKGREQPTKEDATRSLYQNIIEPAFGKMYGIRGANVSQEDVDTAKKNKEIFNEFLEQGVQFQGKPPLKGSPEYRKMVDQILPNLMKQGYDEQSALKRLQIMMYGEPKKALDKIGAGADYYDDLDDAERSAINPFFLVLDALEAVPIAGLPITAAKLGIKATPSFLNAAKKLLDSGVAREQIEMTLKKDFPNDYKNLSGGGFRPDGVVMDSEKGSGLTSSTSRKDQELSGYGSGRARVKNYLVTIDEPQTVEQIAEALNVKLSLVRDFKKTFANDPITQKIRNKDPKNFPEERFTVEGGSTQKITEFLKNQKEPLTQQQIADAVGVTKGIVTHFKFNLDKNSPLIKKFRSDNKEGQTELLKNLFEENPNLTFKNKKELTDKYNISPTTLKNFIQANPQYNKNFEEVAAVVSKSNSNLIDELRTSNRTLDQKLTQLEGFIETNKEEPVNALFKKFGFGDRDPQTNRPLMSLSTFGKYMRDQKGYVSQKQSQKSLFQDYFAQSYGMNKPDKIRADTTMAQDFFRSDFFKNDDEFKSVMKGFGIEPKNITNEAGQKIPNPDFDYETNKIKKQNFYNALTSIMTEGEKGYQKLLKKSKDANALSRDVSEQFYDSLKNNEPFRNQFISEYNRVFPKGSPAHVPDNNWEKMFKRYKSQFTAQLAHITPLKDFKKLEGFKGMGAEPDLMTINFGAHNLAAQPRIENIIQDAVKNINQGRDIEKNLKKLRNANSYMVNNNMRTYLRFTDRTMSDETLKKLQDNLSSIYIGKDNNQKTIFLGRDEEMTLDEMKSLFTEKMLLYIADPKSFKISTGRPKGAKIEDEMLKTGSAPYLKYGSPLNFKKGGPVRMAIGGDPLTNINQQQFTPDPAIDGDSAFQKAVQDENLLAFNPLNLFKIFKQTPAVATPNKVVGGLPDAPTNMLPAAARVDINDFPFQSHFLSTLSEPNIPKMDTPQGWKNLFGGTKGFSQSELEDSGILGYLEDAEKFLPGAKVSQKDLINVYEKSPIANIEIKVKADGYVPGEPEDYTIYTGSAKHRNMGNANIDEGGTDYRNIVINTKEIPGQEKPFFNQAHFDKDPNVIAFTRVANYKNAGGDKVAVIQELQTDLITNLKKEQERLKVTVDSVRREKQKIQDTLDRYPDNEYQRRQLDLLNAQYPEEKLRFLESTNLTRPANPAFLEQLAPDLTRQLNDIQDQINKLTVENVGQVRNPQYVNEIKDLQDKGFAIFNQLYDLNRQQNFDDMLEGVKVTNKYQSDEIQAAGQYGVPSDRDVESFGQIPFNKGQDWIDLMLKATIQDAQSRGINKVAIMPSDIINKRWSKNADTEAGEKFKTIYDKISVQELKNIAKKYTGNKANLQIEEIVDPNKPQQAFQVLNKNVDGTFAKRDRDIEPSMPVGSNIGPDDTADFNYQIYKVASDFDYGDVVVRKEIAPGQVMDYYVKIIESKLPKIDPESGIDMSIARQDTIEFVPLKENQIAEDSKVIIEEFNPSVTKMYTITIPEESKKGPMFLFRKKDGGKIKSDGLVSITDIYGDY